MGREHNAISAEESNCRRRNEHIFSDPGIRASAAQFHGNTSIYLSLVAAKLALGAQSCRLQSARGHKSRENATAARVRARFYTWLLLRPRGSTLSTVVQNPLRRSALAYPPRSSSAEDLPRPSTDFSLDSVLSPVSPIPLCSRFYRVCSLFSGPICPFFWGQMSLLRLSVVFGETKPSKFVVLLHFCTRFVESKVF